MEPKAVTGISADIKSALEKEVLRSRKIFLVRPVCEFTRKAIQAGGITLGHTYHAKDYGPMLRKGRRIPPLVGTFLQAKMPQSARVTSSLFNLYAGGNPERSHGDIRWCRVVFRILKQRRIACGLRFRLPGQPKSLIYHLQEELMKNVLPVALILLRFRLLWCLITTVRRP